MINDLRARIDWLLDQCQSPRLLTWLIGEIIKDIVFHTPCPPPCMELHIWEGQEGTRWRDKANQITAPEWTKDWPTEAGWYWFYGNPFQGDPAHNRLICVKASHLPDGRSYIEIGGVVGVYLEQHEAQGVWLKMQSPEKPDGS